MISFWTRLRVALILTADKRTKYMQKHNIFAGMGENVMFQPRLIPLDAEYIKLHNNVSVASNVTFVGHDVIYSVFNNMQDIQLPRYKGCIEIMDNVFIGSNSTILPNVRIGPNAIVAAGAVVSEDVPEGSVVGGVPAKVIGKFDDLLNARIAEFQIIGDNYDNLAFMWDQFYEKHGDINNKNAVIY